MKLKCSHCDHLWETRKDTVPKQCPYCKYTTHYHKPIVLRK
jgi:rubrerythrin